MNTFVDLVFIFVFVFVLTHFMIVSVKATDIITQKLLIFLAVTIFATLLSVMKSIRRQCPVNTWKAINSGVLVGLFAYIGHTILFDLNYMEGTRDLVQSTRESIPGGLETLLALMIILAIAFGKSMRYIFSVDDCDL
jgi:H+/Cl- antiporter ClcA